ncbi:V-type ATP synthase subunit I [Candidatus Clavichlamydia salmonicola]|uniref:V-type ATPase 116kDa subunit family protein n=1 Tax=Candidatus Clavichlamydia salmonicola TaxID=469812 RepID=UPI001891B3E9|nr:V-type ATPase 116kDa subunit family protein [Candidatus Clavichlamydia salmonicola]MBF5051114.1 V-type ATP synthase subunit I [Candidatus Clavichlamydia salmonicola]
MRAKLKKILFFGPKDNRKQFLKLCRDQSEVEFIGASKELSHKVLSEDAGLISEALMVVQEYQLSEKTGLTDQNQNTAVMHHVERIIELYHTHSKIMDELKHLYKEIEKLTPIGDVTLADIEHLSLSFKKPISFYECIKGHIPAAQNEDDHVVFITHHLARSFFVLIGECEACCKKGIKFSIQISLKDLNKEVVVKEQQIKKIEKELKILSDNQTHLRKAFAQEVDKFRLQSVQSASALLLNDKYFALEGWVPVEQLEQVSKLAQSVTVFIEELTIDPDEVIPTYLQNKTMGKLGEDLVVLYDIPSSQEKDPSKWVLGSFICFFSIIIGDAGYGLIFLLALGLGLFGLQSKKKKIPQATKRFVKLAMILSLACVVWGVLDSAFFGLHISPLSSLKKVSLKHLLVTKKADYLIKNKPAVYKELLKEYPKLQQSKTGLSFCTDVVKQGTVFPIYDMLAGQAAMEIALFIGVIHLTMAFLRHLRSEVSGLGWIIFMLGCYLYVPVYLGTFTIVNYLFGLSPILCGQWGMWMLYGGVSLAMVFILIKKKIAGLAEIALVIQVFSDVLSYVRLYALALAGGMMAQTFNEMAASLPLVLGIVVLLLGHSVNILLGVMGGVIHGLRLNFIEWYHYGFEGGGKLFSPLKKIQIEE